MGSGTFIHLLLAPATAVTLASRKSRTMPVTPSVILASHISCKSNLTIGPSPAIFGLGLTRVTAAVYEIIGSATVQRHLVLVKLISQGEARITGSTTGRSAALTLLNGRAIRVLDVYDFPAAGFLNPLPVLK
ncbi:hypothetical protein, unlikely [Trypanosoma congolense IL3000]|uniref:T. congolense-specific, cell surface-expressed gene family n=1 Tax=Trypanosoma congolense (strain IL3000) TaxID=1068625 RepID=F9WCH3_TRYCI|nr:hypothetical protein, unlikely [Trypanosoma congolense IL3000]